MRLNSFDGSSLELKILGYEFPDIATEDYDSNWLIIEINVTHPKEQWSSRAPCLLTYEVARLADWLENIAHGEETSSTQSFVEPHLKFQLVDPESSKSLLIFFDMEAKSDLMPSNQEPVEDLWIKFQILDLNLEAAAKSLRQQLVKYPQRAAK
jgi:hypothetical protein